MAERKKQHYLDNKEFLRALIEYRKSVAIAKENGEPKPKVNNFLGECFLKIATHLSYRPNFINYMYKDDMICDGIENCLQYIDNFDPEKSSNPFAYFTQVIYFAFLRRIAKEKRQMDIKDKLIERTGFQEVFTSDAGGSESDYNQIKSNIQHSSRY
jgi:hypothetical protein